MPTAPIILAQLESKLNLLEAALSSSNFPELVALVQDTKVELKRKQFDFLLRALEKLTVTIAKNRSLQKILSSPNFDLKPNIQDIGSLQAMAGFKMAVNIIKKDLLKAFMELQRVLKTIRLLTPDNRLVVRIDSFQDDLLIFSDKLFHIESPEDELKLVQQFSTLSQLVRSIKINLSSGDAESREFKSEPYKYKQLMQLNAKMLQHWNTIARKLGRSMELSVKQIKPQALILIVKSDGVEGLNLRS